MDSVSHLGTLSCEVPQDSVLGTTLFVLYMADVGRIIRARNLLPQCFADDTQLYFSDRPQESACLKSRVIICIEDIAECMASNLLKINSANSVFLWCAAARRLHHVDNNIRAKLGCLLRRINEHGNPCQPSRQYVRVPATSYAGHQISTRTAVQLINSFFVILRIDYCNSLLVGLTAYQLDRVQSILNFAARLIFGRAKYDHVTPILRNQLH